MPKSLTSRMDVALNNDQSEDTETTPAGTSHLLTDDGDHILAEQDDGNHRILTED